MNDDELEKIILGSENILNEPKTQRERDAAINCLKLAIEVHRLRKQIKLDFKLLDRISRFSVLKSWFKLHSEDVTSSIFDARQRCRDLQNEGIIKTRERGFDV